MKPVKVYGMTVFTKMEMYFNIKPLNFKTANTNK